MFAGLIAGFQSVRTSLLNGYALIFMGWLLWPRLQWVPGLDGVGGSELGIRLEVLFVKLGTGAQLGALSFGAAMLGAGADRLVVSRVLEWLEQHFGAPDWDAWIASMRTDLKRYGESISYESAFREGNEPSRLSVSSHFYEQALWEDYQDAKREKSEALFRLNILVVGVPVGFLLLFEGLPWIFVAVLTWSLLGYELSDRWEKRTDSLTKTRLEQLDNQIFGLERRIRKRLPKLPEHEMELIRLEEEREEVEKHRFRQFKPPKPPKEPRSWRARLKGLLNRLLGRLGLGVIDLRDPEGQSLEIKLNEDTPAEEAAPAS